MVIGGLSICRLWTGIHIKFVSGVPFLTIGSRGGERRVEESCVCTRGHLSPPLPELGNTMKTVVELES